MKPKMSTRSCKHITWEESNKIVIVSKFNFSVLRLDKSVSRAGPQNAAFTRLTRQQVNRSITKHLLTGQQQNG